MRHRNSVNKLGRTQSERRALMRSLALSVITKGAIRTTVPKAKALRTFLEPLVTKAKIDSLSNRRHIASRIPNKNAVKSLFQEYGPRYSSRSGGYLRIVKISGHRKGDGTVLAEVQWV